MLTDAFITDQMHHVDTGKHHDMRTTIQSRSLALANDGANATAESL
jgi:hypothetical protein